MQVNATLIAAQQAAREAQARFQTAHFTAPQAAALGASKTAATPFASALQEEGFAPLALKQTAPVQAPAAQQPAAPGGRPGSLINIVI